MGLALLVARPGDIAADAVSEALRSAGGADVRGLEVGAHADRFDASALRRRGELRLIGAAMTSRSVLKPQPRPEILAIDPYVPGKSRVAGVAKVHKLSSNESPLGPSPKAVEAVRAMAWRS